MFLIYYLGGQTNFTDFHLAFVAIVGLILQVNCHVAILIILLGIRELALGESVEPMNPLRDGPGPGNSFITYPSQPPL